MYEKTLPPTRTGTIDAGIGTTTYRDGIERFERLAEPKTVEIYQEFGIWAYWYQIGPAPAHLAYQCKVRVDLIRYE